MSGASKSRDVDHAAWAILYEFAKDHGITQGQIGDAAGVTDGQVSRYSKGLRASSAAELYRAAEFVGLDIGELLNRAGRVAASADLSQAAFDFAARNLDSKPCDPGYQKGAPDEHLDC